MRTDTESADQQRTIPRTVAPRHDCIAWGDYDREADVCPVYNADGSLWFIIDGATGKALELRQDGDDEPVTPEQELAFFHEMADKSPSRAKCYFIGGETGLIKIGFSIDPVARLRGFQSGSPVTLSILATRDGGETRETAYHFQFAEHRVRGEWFARSPEILAEIVRLNQQVPA